MKSNWKSIVLYIIRVIELLLAGAAGGAMPQLSVLCLGQE